MSLPFLSALHDRFFDTIHRCQLIYNTCWEDPRIDRQLLGLTPQSRAVVITSAGCNILDYLLDSPAAIYAVDSNPRQNALLQLKCALLRQGDFDALFAMFGEGVSRRSHRQSATLRSLLPPEAAAFWEHKWHYFAGEGLRNSFYYHGTAGTVAWTLKRYLLHAARENREAVFALFESQTLEEQRSWYQRLEPLLWSGLIPRMLNHAVLLSLVGVPRAQIDLLHTRYPGGVAEFVRAKLRHVLTAVPIHDNYFWRVYVTGSYTRACCPNYLQPDNLPLLQQNVDTVTTHNLSVHEFLHQHPGAYSHFVLLDHQDWFVSHNPQALREEWQLILRNSIPGTRILWRSASDSLAHLPHEVTPRLRLYPQLTMPLHHTDRVGTYGSVHLAEVQ